MDLVLHKVGLKVFIADKSITICVEISEDLESARLSYTECCVFDLSQEASEASCCRLVVDVASRICHLEVFVDESRRRIGTLVCGKSDCELIGIFLEDKRSDSANVCGSML